MLITPIYWNRFESAVTPDLYPIGSVTSYIGSPAFNPCEFGNGLDDEGTNGRYFVATNACPKLRGSVSFWFKAIYSQSSGNYFFGDHGGYVPLYVWHDGSYLYCYVGNYAITYKFTCNWSNNEKFHLAITWDGTLGSGSRCSVFKNSSPLTLVASSPDAGWADTGNGTIGSNHPPYLSAQKGIMDNLKIYDVCIPVDQIIWDMGQEAIDVSYPTGLTSSQGTYTNKVALSWDSIAGVSPEYKIQRANSIGGTYSDIAGMDWQPGLSFDDTTVISNTHYFYKVKARIGTNESVLSDPVEGWSLNLTPVPTPTGLFSSQGSYDSRVHVSWDAIAGVSPEYEILRSDTSTGSYVDISGWQTGLTFNDLTVLDSVHYFYKVKARIGVDESSLSDPVEGWSKSGSFIPALNNIFANITLEFSFPPYYQSATNAIGLSDMKCIIRDVAGNFYVSDGSLGTNSIYKYDKNFNLITSWSGFTSTGEMAIYQGFIYACDTGSGYIKKFDLNGTYISQFTYSGMSPYGIAINSNNYLLVTDVSIDRVIVFDNDGTFISSFGSSGSSDGNFSYPLGIGVDSNDNIFVVDNGNLRIQKFNSSYIFNSKLDGMVNPICVKIDENDRVYISDFNENQVLKYDGDFNYMTEMENSGISGVTGFCLRNEKEIYAIDYGNNSIIKFVDTVGAYNLYQSFNSSTGFVLIGTYLKSEIITSTGLQYIEYQANSHIVDGRNMYYYINAMSTNGIESSISPIILVETPITPIDNLVIYNNAEKTRLNWNPINTSTGMNQNFTAYQVWKEKMTGLSHGIVNVDSDNVQITFSSDYTGKFIKIYHPSLKTSWQGFVSTSDGLSFTINNDNKIFGEMIINYNNIKLNDLHVYMEGTPVLLTSTTDNFYDDTSFVTDSVYLYKVYGVD